MQAIVYDRWGGADEFRFAERPVPEVGAFDALVRVRAASLNPIDWKIRNGDLRLLARGGFPRTPGIDFAGEVARVGRGVTGLRVGDAVFGILKPLAPEGSLADFVVAPADMLMPKPAHLDFEEAASVPLAGLTALQALDQLGGLRRGGHCLILGASGGVGTFAVQIARALGAEVVATTSERHLDLVADLGADEAVDYRRTRPERIRGPFDVIFDVVGASSYAAMRGQLAAPGVYVSTLPGPVAFAASALSSLSTRKAKVVVMNANAADLRRLQRWLVEGAIRPVVGHRFALDEVREAFELSESGRATGKIAVTIA